MPKNKHNENVGSSITRTDERIDSTGEVFTPAELCAEMVSEIPESILKNENSTFLDNSAGSGNFLLALQTELLKYHELSHINDNMLYAVELMPDNHAELCDYSFGKPVGLESFFE
jgi:type I restriction-modification system DNA methylase subunit